MPVRGLDASAPESPSTRREWIEIMNVNNGAALLASPSTRREWIEIVARGDDVIPRVVSLHTEGVD